MTATPGTVATDFYQALATSDASSVAAIIADHFAEDIVLDLPESLPYGGQVRGAAKLARMFGHLAASPPGTGVHRLSVKSVVANETQVAVHLTFDWVSAGGAEPLASSVVELWTFEAGRAVSIQAFYRDTAALLDAERPAGGAEPGPPG